ncbi:MAG TPA: nuclear transport factor 2 family protein, partial [Acidimicrobiia bacterium]|nr:nuclear transport factor 2 family protein [Acidimicrobiia bacterium]
MSQFSASEQTLIDAWEAHTAAEFESKDADAALAVMTDDPALVHVAVGTGAAGRDALRAFYAEVFIPQLPPDMGLDLLSRCVSVEQGRLVDEFLVHLTHTVQMDWFVPGLAPTGRTVVLPHVAVIAFEGNRIKSEHIYWDQGSALRQLGVFGDDVPVLGPEIA